MSTSVEGDFPSRSTAVLVVTTVTLILASISVFARLVSRFAIVQSHTLDDYVMVFAWFVAFGLSFSIDYGTSKGLGRHDANIPKSWFPALIRSEYAFSILYNVALMATKSSILIFYLRLSRNTNKPLRIASYVTLAVVNVAGIVLTFLNVFQCAPLGAIFDTTIANAKCMSIVILYLASAPVNIITDLAILVLPLPVLTGMRLPKKQKTILVMTFALGIFVVVVDVVRTYYLQQSATDVTVGSLSQPSTTSRMGGELDFAWYASLALMWSAVEVNVGIICANIPTLKPLIKRILPAMIIDLTSRETEKRSSCGSQSPLESNQADAIRLGSVAPENYTSGGIRPLPPAQLGGDQEYEMNMLDFLTTPEHIGMARTRSRHTEASENSVYFGFVNMKRPKSMLNTSPRESFKYCLLVTTLFFLWGFSYGLLNTLNIQISILAGTSEGQAVALETAYFGAYLAGPLTVGQYVLRHSGFKATFITGLCIYGVGTLMFWPSAVLTSYAGFIISNFVVGFGLSVLETAANPFLALCGHERYSEVRLLIAQGIQGIGSVLSQVLAEKVLFANVLEHPSLIDVQWTYLAIALFTVILSLFFNYMPLPEATDTDLQMLAEKLEIYPQQKFFSKFPVIYTTLGLAVFAQALYVGIQQSLSFFFPLLLYTPPNTTNTLTTSVDNYVTISLVTFAMGRFLAAGFCYIMKPRILLLLIFLSGIIFSALTMSLNSSPNTIAGPTLVIFLLEGPVWPLIFAIGLRGLGCRTKSGAAYLTAAASGGAVFPLVMFAAQRVNHQSTQRSFCVVVALFAAATLFPAYLNFSSKARHQIDPRRPGSENYEDTYAGDRPLSPIKRLSKQFQIIVLSKVSGRKRTSSDLLVVEHRERASFASNT